MVNGQPKSPQEPRILVPDSHSTPKPDGATLTCHRFFAPVVVPEPDPLNPRILKIRPRMGNFPCIVDKCMLWNVEDRECYDVTAAKAQKNIGDYAFNLKNDVHIDGGGM